jgi:hypothetical protein
VGKRKVDLETFCRCIGRRAPKTLRKNANIEAARQASRDADKAAQQLESLKREIEDLQMDGSSDEKEKRRKLRVKYSNLKESAAEEISAVQESAQEMFSSMAQSHERDLAAARQKAIIYEIGEQQEAAALAAHLAAREAANVGVGEAEAIAAAASETRIASENEIELMKAKLKEMEKMQSVKSKEQAQAMIAQATRLRRKMVKWSQKDEDDSTNFPANPVETNIQGTSSHGKESPLTDAGKLTVAAATHALNQKRSKTSRERVAEESEEDLRSRLKKFLVDDLGYEGDFENLLDELHEFALTGGGDEALRSSLIGAASSDIYDAFMEKKPLPLPSSQSQSDSLARKVGVGTNESFGNAEIESDISTSSQSSQSAPGAPRHMPKSRRAAEGKAKSKSRSSKKSKKELQNTRSKSRGPRSTRGRRGRSPTTRSTVTGVRSRSRSNSRDDRREHKRSETPRSPRANVSPDDQEHHIDLLFDAQDIFAKLDVDGSGVLEGEELVSLAKWVGKNFMPRGRKLTRRQKRALEKSIQDHAMKSDGDDALNFEEFSEWFIPELTAISAGER